MIVTMLGLLVGLVVLAAGLVYFKKEKNDPESRKIYGVISLIGAALLIGMLIRLLTTVL